jgi:alpha-1,4-digalacturonate transport system permease protein
MIQTNKRLKHKSLDTKQKWAFLFCAPNILLFIVFFIGPAVLGISYSFTNYNGLSRMDFVGFANYAKLFNDPEFYRVLLNTFKFIIVSVPLVYFTSLFLAILLNNESLKGNSAMRILIYWPTLLSTIMVGLTWRWIFGENFGILNYLLELGNMSKIRWATDGNAAFITTVIASVWSTCGTNMLIFIGGLKQIPQSLHEAAKIDGATPFQDFIYVTLPGLSAVSFMIIILSIITAFKSFAMVLTLTGGGPGSATTYMIQYIYQTGFDKMQVGYSSAASMVMFIILMIISIVQTRHNSKVERG